MFENTWKYGSDCTRLHLSAWEAKSKLCSFAYISSYSFQVPILCVWNFCFWTTLFTIITWRYYFTSGNYIKCSYKKMTWILIKWFVESIHVTRHLFCLTRHFDNDWSLSNADDRSLAVHLFHWKKYFQEPIKEHLTPDYSEKSP